MVGVACEHKRQVCGETVYEWSNVGFTQHIPHIARTPRKCKDCGTTLPEMISRAFETTYGIQPLVATERMERYVGRQRASQVPETGAD